jgi:hypothetical protein
MLAHGRFGEIVLVKYDISFIKPARGVAPISVENCVPAVCQNSTAFTYDVSPLDHIVNANSPNIIPSGLSDIVVQFSHAVHVKGDVRLEINDTGFDRSISASRSQRVQIIEIDSPSGKIESNTPDAGQFQLEYAGLRTGCIDWDVVNSESHWQQATEGDTSSNRFSNHLRDANYQDGTSGRFSMRGRLEELPSIASLGIKSVTRKPHRNGAKFIIEFTGGEPHLLRPVTYLSPESNPCLPFSPRDTVVSAADTPNVTFQYPLPSSPSLFLIANSSVAENELLDLVVPIGQGIKLPEIGMKENAQVLTINMKSIAADYSSITVAKSPAVAAALRSSISFSSSRCGSPTAIFLQLSFSEILESGDTIKIVMPLFGNNRALNTNLQLNGTSKGLFNGQWSNRNLTLTTTARIPAFDVVDITISSRNNITLPAIAIDEVQCNFIKFSVNTAAGGSIIEQKSFEH